MGKVLFVLELLEPKLRKEHAPPSKRHKDATKYSRKQKHKARRDEAPDDSGASFFYLDNRNSSAISTLSSSRCSCMVRRSFLPFIL